MLHRKGTRTYVGGIDVGYVPCAGSFMHACAYTLVPPERYPAQRPSPFTMPICFGLHWGHIRLKVGVQ